MRTQRRPFIQALMGLPIFAAVADWATSSDSTDGHRNTPEFKKFMQAMVALRVINTAAARHREKFHQYPLLSELPTSEPVRAWLRSEYAIEAGYPEFFDSAQFGAEEIVPGWHCDFKLNAERTEYVVMLRDSSDRPVSDTTPPALTTNQRGIIYQGRPDPAVSFAQTWNPESLVQGHSIRVKHETGGFGSVMKGLALGVTVPVHAESGGSCNPCCGWVYCCCDAWCNCFGSMHCQGGDPGTGTCTNCGCECCVWCC